MRERRLTARLAAVFLVPAVLVAACGGAASSPGAGASGAIPSTGIGLPSDMIVPSFAIPSFDLSGLVTNLENVDSYKVSIGSSDGTAYSGTIVLKPAPARDLYVGSGDNATHIVKIGEETWVGTGSGPLKPAPAGMVDAMLPLFDPGTLLAIFANASILQYADKVGEEDKNGQPTTHYKLDAAKIPNFGAMGLAGNGTIEMWISDDGYLVSFLATDFGASKGTLAIDVTDVNDPANVVERPS